MKFIFSNFSIELSKSLQSHFSKILIAFPLLIAFASVAMANEVANARAAYINSLASALHQDPELTKLKTEVTEAQRELSSIQDSKKQALKDALMGPQAKLKAAEVTVEELAEQNLLEPLRIAVIPVEVTQLEQQLKKAIDAADRRKATIARLDTQLKEITRQQQDTASSLAAAEVSFASAKALLEDFNSVQTLALTSEGLQNPLLINYIWSSIPPTELLLAARGAFLKDVTALFESEKNITQFRFPTSLSVNKWKFEDVPSGNAWLLWDVELNTFPEFQPQLIDLSEQFVFLRLVVSGNANTEVQAADLPRISMNDVDVSFWKINNGSEYDACLKRLAPSEAVSAIRKLCQKLFPSDARYDVDVFDKQGFGGTAILMSGAQTLAFTKIYQEYLGVLRGLATGELSVELLPFVQSEIFDYGDQIAQKVTNANEFFASVKRAYSTVNAKVVRLQKEKADANLTDKAASAEDLTIAAKVAERLAILQKELTFLENEHAQETASLANRQAASATALTAAEETIASAKIEVDQAWEARLQSASQAVVSAQQRLATAISENSSIKQETAKERRRYLRELARSEIELSLDIDYNKLCVNLRNVSGRYARVALATPWLFFRGKPWTRWADLDGISDGDYLFKELKKGPKFRNKYSEVVTGLRPNGAFKECSFIQDPTAGKLGRYFDSIGGYKASYWDLKLDVQYGTFKNTDKAITMEARDKTYADELNSVITEARNAKPTAMEIDL